METLSCITNLCADINGSLSADKVNVFIRVCRETEPKEKYGRDNFFMNSIVIACRTSLQYLHLISRFQIYEDNVGHHKTRTQWSNWHSKVCPHDDFVANFMATQYNRIPLLHYMMKDKKEGCEGNIDH